MTDSIRMAISEGLGILSVCALVPHLIPNVLSMVQAASTSITPAAAAISDTQLTLPLAYLWVVIGVILSIALPILRALLPQAGGASRIGGPSFWAAARPYLVVGAFSLLTGVLILAFSSRNLSNWSLALLAGYAWDSTLQKLTI